MNTKDKDTRYYLDINVKTWEVANKGLGDRHDLIKNMPSYPIHRVFITKGQYDKLLDKA